MPDGVSPSALLGALGMPGMTAWIGVTEIAPVEAGETVFISAAAGAVGSVAGQIAKARGCRVIGSAGAPEKVAYVRDELGFDAAFSYRDDVRAALKEAAPDGVDVYFDNVGGPQLEAAIGALNRGGRIALCGSVSGYNATEPPPGPRNMALLVGKRARLRGFIVGDHYDRFGEFRAEVEELLAGGRLKIPETIVEGGIEAAPRRVRRRCSAASTSARWSCGCSRWPNVNGGWVGKGFGVRRRWFGWVCAEHSMTTRLTTYTWSHTRSAGRLEPSLPYPAAVDVRPRYAAQRGAGTPSARFKAPGGQREQRDAGREREQLLAAREQAGAHDHGGRARRRVRRAQQSQHAAGAADRQRDRGRALEREARLERARRVGEPEHDQPAVGDRRRRRSGR